MKPKLSIIIPTWNTADITLKCVNTILKHTPPGFTQIIIVDNGSTDETQEKLGKLKNITYIRNDSNLGFSKGNNVGAAKAVADILLFLNSDMELIDSSIVDMVEYFHINPSIGLLGPRFLNPDLTPQGSVTPPQTALNAFKEYWLGMSHSYSKYTPDSSVPISVWTVSGGAVMISSRDYKTVGGWDEKYFFYYEDLELCRQIRGLNKQVVYYPQCQVIHRHGASGTTVATAQNQWRRLIPSSIKYHGYINHYLINSVIWLSQKLHLPLTK